MKGPLLDRCIVINLEKAPPDSKLAPTRENVLERIAQPLREQLGAYSVQRKDELMALYDAEPTESYWPILHNREAELWTPLLMHAKVFGAECEARALQVARSFSNRKLRIAVSDDTRLSQASELLNVLESGNKPTFSPGKLIRSLEHEETWGDLFSGKGDSAKSALVGRFIRSFGILPTGKLHGGHWTYDTSIVITKLCAHIPPEPPPGPEHTHAVNKPMDLVGDDPGTTPRGTHPRENATQIDGDKPDSIPGDVPDDGDETAD